MAAALPPLGPSDFDDPSRPDTPLASQKTTFHRLPIIETPIEHLSGPSSISPLQSPSSSENGQFLLPVASINKPQHVFSLSDVINAEDESIGPLPAEMEFADLAVAPDGTFIETSSGPAAREIKLRYDQRYGVSVSTRSPYTITAFVNQHGKQMYRIGHRELFSAPAASAAEVEERIIKTSSETSHSPRTKRRSRMSMQNFLPQSVFVKTTAPSLSRPQTAASHQSSGPRKLRKTRSIPDMGSASGDPSEPNGRPSTGRAHSQSVTAVDVPRYSATFDLPPPPALVAVPSRSVDIFAEVMEWFPATSTTSTSLSTNSLFSAANPHVLQGVNYPARAFITQPFGAGVTFNAPSPKPAFDFLPAPRLLREMHSFESGLTARQVDSHSSLSPVPSEPGTPELEVSRPPSAIRLRASTSSFSADHESPAEPQQSASADADEPSESTILHDFPTDVFDVLQTYRGLPLLEKLSEGIEGTTVIKLSASADQSAAPRDDPRFVIWGEAVPEWDHEEYLTSRDSFNTDASSPSGSLSLSMRRSSKVSKVKSQEIQSLRSTSGLNTQRVLLAATIERWIAQLTSDLNYDELLDFFLTYRTYVCAVDLCNLLIARFHWALQKPSSQQDETIRRIVRVRTFVAIRYWLLTFFTVDFIPNRELRLLIADWLNALIRDPVLKKHIDGLGIVRRLVKVAKECKQAHTRASTKPKAQDSPPKPATTTSEKQDHLLGKQFAEATSKKEEDSDLDLDFLPDEASVEEATSDPANAHLTAGHHAGGALSPTRPASLPLSSFNILQRTDHAPGPGPEAEVVQVPVPLPSHHSALSRAFVKTIGRLGRWKRVLNSRSAARTSISACAGASAFDLELSLSRDLLTVNGGVEQYLGTAGPQSSSKHTPLALPSTTPVLPPVLSSQQYNPATSPVPTVIPAEKRVSASPLTPVQSYEPPSEASNEESTPSTISAQNQEPLVTDVAEAQAPVQEEEEYDIVRSSERAESFHSSSTDSLGEPLQPGIPSTFSPPSQSQWQFDIVSIDDLDLSDSSSEVHEAGPAAPPGLRRTPRKLPMRRDFEFVRRSEVSSMGIVSHNSMASGPSSSNPSSAGLGNLAQWQINAIVDSLTDDGQGDVDDALRRLEGQINPQKLQEKASKVDGWVRTIRERMAAGDYTNEEPRFPTDSDSDEEVADDANEDDEEDRHESVSVHNLSNSTPSIIVPDDLNEEDQDGAFDSARTPIPTQSAHMIPHPPGLGSPPQSTDVSKRDLDVVLTEVIPDQVASPATGTTTLVSSRPETLSSKFANPDAPRIHKSFVLSCRTTTLAEHFTMIDRELFMGIKFEELVADDWMACEEVSVLDWAQYQKDRAKWKTESQFPEKTSALAAVRARFNLMAHFVISEIVLTQPAERHYVVAKFLRVAWKCYEMSSFNTLTAIITALQSEWVNRAMRRAGWNKVPTFETRVFKILKDFTTNADEFKFIRKLVESIVESKPFENGSRAASVVSGGNTDQSSKGKAATDKAHIPTACVPFFGIYLAQLYKINKLPALIDPTAPNQGVGFDPISATLDPPAHPEAFSALAPLPATMNLEPLINVHKQRRIAAVIKSLVAGQHLASRIHYEVDKKLFPRCLRLRGLESDTLQLVFDSYSDQ